MTVRAQNAGDAVIGEVLNGGDYVRLGDVDAGRCCAVALRSKAGASRCGSSFWWWARVALLGAFVSACVLAVIIFAGPVFIKKVVIPVLNWVEATFSNSVLALLLFCSFALFPAVLLPSSPSMWIAGMTFGYGYGFLLIMAGISIGMTFPFFIGSLFRHKIQRWLEKWPKKAAIIRLAGEGDWFHQFKAVTFLRISPFPYLIFNYASVATNVQYGPYISGSLVGTVPEVFLAIYSGILLRSLADATDSGGFLSAEQLIYTVLGLCIAVASTIAITIYAKRNLQILQVEDELNLFTLSHANYALESTGVGEIRYS